MHIKILGIYGKESKDLEKKLTKILNRIGLKAKFTVHDDIDMLLKYNLTKTPAIQIEENIIENKYTYNESELEEKLFVILQYNDKNQIKK